MIECEATYKVKCDRCPKYLMRTAKQVYKFDSESAAARFANKNGWLVTSTQVRCEVCKAIA